MKLIPAALFALSGLATGAAASNWVCEVDDTANGGLGYAVVTFSPSTAVWVWDDKGETYVEQDGCGRDLCVGGNVSRDGAYTLYSYRILRNAAGTPVATENIAFFDVEEDALTGNLQGWNDSEFFVFDLIGCTQAPMTEPRTDL